LSLKYFCANVLSNLLIYKHLTAPVNRCIIPHIKLTKYISRLEEGSSVVQNRDPLSFWSQLASSFRFIADVAHDLLAALASQAFVERIFFTLRYAYPRSTPPGDSLAGDARLFKTE